MDFTLLELHLPEAQFNAPFSGNRPSTEEEDNDEASGSFPWKLLVVLGLLGLVTVALIWWLALGSDGTHTLDEFGS